MLFSTRETASIRGEERRGSKPCSESGDGAKRCVGGKYNKPGHIHITLRRLAIAPSGLFD